MDKNSFNLQYENEENKLRIKEKFVEKIGGFDFKMIQIIEGCIFIGMCARHYDSLERQKAMFITGLNILNDVNECI